MKPARLYPVLALVAATALTPSLTAQEIAPTFGITWPVIGRIKPRSAAEIVSSPWSIGGETIDRDFTTYDHFKPYLGPLGAKGIRLQAGWAKCEKVRGTYDFTWLDAIIDDARAQGMQPWLELSYGNTLYPGGGDTGLGGGLPNSPEGLAAWDRWTRAVVEHYRDRVQEWEIWNEPDLNRKGTAPVEAYVELYIRTARMIREVQPQGQIWALALANNPVYADQFLAGMAAKGKLDLIDAITFHGYPRNPDDTTLVDALRASIAKHGGKCAVRQGETGAPSHYQENFALRNITFTETTQAKWDLRRMLAHRAKDVPMNLFTIVDMHYTTASSQGGADGKLRMNYKGLLGTNPDQSISRVKAAYGAAQTLFAIFDNTLKRVENYPFNSTALRGLALTGYRRESDGAQVVAYWYNDAPPAEGSGVDRVDVVLAQGKFTEPALVDLRTGLVYALPPGAWSQDENGLHIRALPVYDSPLLVGEKAVFTLLPVAP